MPGLDGVALSKRLLSATYLLIETHDILLDVSSAGACPPLSSTMEVGGRDTAKVAYSRAVPATLVKDIARMVVLNRGIYERVNIASEQRTRCGVCQKQCPANAAETKSVVPVAGDLPGEYFVLYGCRKPAKDDTPSQSTSAGDDEEEEYTQVACRRIGLLLLVDSQGCARCRKHMGRAPLQKKDRWR